MKKIFFKITILYLITMTTISCGDEFLDEPKPTTTVTGEVIFTSREGAEALISGIMRRMRRQFTSVDSAGLSSLYFARDVKGNDVIQRATWYRFDYENENREPTYRRTKFNWEFPYYIINQANSLINGVEASDVLSDVDKKELIGQGKAIRAFFYFQLALEYQHTYSYDPSLPGPPIYLELSLEGKPMGTLQQVYDQILLDLTDAVRDLPATRLGKTYINNATANGMLARVYQTMGNKWPEAEEAANKAYGSVSDINTVLEPSTYGDGFKSVSNSEWIWGSEQFDDQSDYYYGAPHNMVDPYGAYKATFFNNDFVALFSATDVRNTFIHYYAVPATDYRNWATTKFDFQFDSDRPIMRTAEMILVEAEAKYHNSDAIGSHNLLYALQKNRDPNAIKSTNAGPALLEEILVERRKELYCEIGVEWFDAKRYRRGIPRTGNQRIKGASVLAPDDKRFFLKIPQDEIDANENIDESVNANR